MKIDCVIPVYNEGHIFAENAARIYDFLQTSPCGAQWRLVFAVNGSTESFERMVAKFCATHSNAAYEVLQEPGKGRAIKHCFTISDADILMYMDVDLATNLRNVSDLIQPIMRHGADVSFGSRMHPNSKRDRSGLREMSSRAYIFISKIILAHQFSDLQCGFKALTNPAWRQIAPQITDDHWFFDTQLLYWAQQYGLRIVEIPISWSENRYGMRQSKVKVVRDGLAFIAALVRLRLRRPLPLSTKISH